MNTSQAELFEIIMDRCLDKESKMRFRPSLRILFKLIKNITNHNTSDKNVMKNIFIVFSEIFLNVI